MIGTSYICKSFLDCTIWIEEFLNVGFIDICCDKSVMIESDSLIFIVFSFTSIFLIDLFRISCTICMYINLRNHAKNPMVFSFFHYIYNIIYVFRCADNFSNTPSSAFSVIHSNKILPVFFNQCSTSQSSYLSTSKTCAKTESFKFRSIMVNLCWTTSGDIFSFPRRSRNKVCWWAGIELT